MALGGDCEWWFWKMWRGCSGIYSARQLPGLDSGEDRAGEKSGLGFNSSSWNRLCFQSERAITNNGKTECDQIADGISPESDVVPNPTNEFNHILYFQPELFDYKDYSQEKRISSSPTH